MQTLAAMRSSLNDRFKKNLSDLDTRDDVAIADAVDAWQHATQRLTRETYAYDRARLSALVARKTTESARWFAGAARDHVAAELGILSYEAARVAGRGTYPIDEAAHAALADGLLARLDPAVAASDNVPASLVNEAYQVERIVSNESFVAYNRTRDAMQQALVSGGDRDAYAVTADLARDAGDWIPGILKRWSALLDRRVCPTCKRLNGEIRLLGMAFDGGPNAPVHVGCRCVVGFWPIAVPKRK